ncbi:hypothetical protein [Fibrobacter sp. UWR2]|uniref:hypothetical protein n=1 Tax=Fibrobacter sp. UWR2 TaxID=1964352 RepID=UPI000B521806|nr:hypothetical protein [Fibrobacter sp. UWR2]OWU99019.1 hypothetical protein B7994_12480 [Fibrobacter sp. UWR2]
MDEQTEKKVRKTARMLKYMFLRVEVIIGFFAMIAGAIVTAMVWSEGYFAGALMMVLTGALNIYLAIKELVAPTDGILHWQAVFFMIVRRAMFFLNIALLALVLGTFTNLI